MRIFALTALALTLTPAQGAQAQAAPPHHPWKIHDALDLPDWLTLRGDVRARYETLSRQFRPGLPGSDQGLFLRTNIFAEAKFAPFRIGAELIDSRSYLTDAGSGVTADDVNAAELVQAYGAVTVKSALSPGDKLDAQFGRFTMDLGSSRLAGRHAFRNTTNAFTGLRVDWSDSKATSLTLFYTLPHTRLPNDRESILNNKVVFDTETFDLTFWGALLTRKDLPFGATGEIFCSPSMSRTAVSKPRTGNFIRPARASCAALRPTPGISSSKAACNAAPPAGRPFLPRHGILACGQLTCMPH